MTGATPNAVARVLLLDGYAESREASAAELRRAGFEVIAVEEEEQAVAAVAAAYASASAAASVSASVSPSASTRAARAAQSRAVDIDIVVLDVPLAEAREAAKALEEAASGIHPAPRRRPSVIALASPSDARPSREAAHASGVDYVLLRPCPPPALAKHLRRLHLPRALPGTQRR